MTRVRIPAGASHFQVGIPYIKGKSGGPAAQLQFSVPIWEKPAPRREDRQFYGESEKDFERRLENAKRKGIINPDDFMLIRSYILELRAINGIGILRMTKLAYLAASWRHHIGPYRQNTLPDLHQGILGLKNRGQNGIPYRQNTLRDHLGFLKRFYVWLIENDYLTLPKEHINRIRVPACDHMTVTASDILTGEEVESLIGACMSSRDRALFGVLYEGGFRIQELCTLMWSQVKFDEYGAVLNVNMKTEKPRHVRIIATAPLLASWRDDCPYEPEGETLVFMTHQRRPLNHAAVWSQLRKIVDRAGIRKPVHPHLLRHSRISHLQQQGVQESIIKGMMWGNQGTKMLETYSHISSNDIDRVLLDLYGIARRENQAPTSMVARQCQGCCTINPPTSRFCRSCGSAISVQ